MTDAREANVADPSKTTAAVSWLQPLAVPPVVASLGHAYAVEWASDAEPVEPDGVPLPASLHGAVASRRRTFFAGRVCAREALRVVRPDRQDLPAIGAFGAPVWPEGITGSITHAATRAIAVVSPTTIWRSIGIDCERIMSAAAADEIAARVLPEADQVTRRGSIDERLAWPTFLTVVFSAKESIYKCLNPLTGRFFEFDAVALEWIDLAAGTMRFQVRQELRPAAPTGTLLTARFCVEGEHVVTAVALPPSAPAPAV